MLGTSASQGRSHQDYAPLHPTNPVRPNEQTTEAKSMKALKAMPMPCFIPPKHSVIALHNRTIEAMEAGDIKTLGQCYLKCNTAEFFLPVILIISAFACIQWIVFSISELTMEKQLSSVFPPAVATLTAYDFVCLFLSFYANRNTHALAAHALRNELSDELFSQIAGQFWSKNGRLKLQAVMQAAAANNKLQSVVVSPAPQLPDDLNVLKRSPSPCPE